ncbi:MOSC domain-containing protein [Thalassospira sp. SM2505]|uniref:MOSC domain-containing protein n=1 Tax=Thalassospira sp. CH_XMU1448-2 TaxID=3107773 RepID=UPI003009A714
MTVELKAIKRYPVKGLRGIDMPSATITAHKMITDDRRFVIGTQSSLGQDGVQEWARKSNFLQLVNTPKLTELGTEYDESTCTLTILRNGRAICKGKLDDAMGRTVIEDFLKAFLKNDVAGTPKIYSAPDTQFGDMKEPYISILNLASIRDFGTRIVQADVDPMRFRGNLLIDGLDPWKELEWEEGQIIKINGASFRFIHPITRCKATSVNPDTAVSDINVPLMLRKGVNHLYMGVYVEAMEDVTLTPGNAITID